MIAPTKLILGIDYRWVASHSTYKSDSYTLTVAIALRLTSRTRELAKQGIEIEDLLQELKQENDLAEKYGVTLEVETLPDISQVVAEDEPAPPPEAKPKRIPRKRKKALRGMG